MNLETFHEHELFISYEHIELIYGLSLIDNQQDN